MPGAQVADEISCGKPFTSGAVAMICTLLAKKVEIGLLLSNFLGVTLMEWVDMASSDFAGTIGAQQELYPLRRQNSVPYHLIDIKKSPPLAHPEHK
jgi:hypothetical protein